MAFEILETHEMLEVVRTVPPLRTYWLDQFFDRVHNSQSEWIDFDIIDKSNRLAPFVAPNVQGQPIVQRGFSTRKFKPAYLKPKSPLDPARLLLRQAGEAPLGAMSLQQREDAIVADILTEHRDMITRRWEWMACQAIKDGAITIEGENYPRVTLSFGRHTDNTEVLLTTEGWNQTTGLPLADIDTWMTGMQIRSGGYAPTRITFSPEAFAAFLGNPSVIAMMDSRRGSSMSVESSPGDGNPVRFAGRLPNGVELWVYNDTYEDNNGEQVRFLAAGEIVLTSPAIGGVRAYGAIMDRKAQYQSLPIFQKMYEQEDPSGLFILSQSAPLMVPTRPNASMKVQVLT